MTSPPAPTYGPRYEEALAYAARLHADQFRKAGPGVAPTIPYVAHLLEVSSLVWLGGGDEDQAIAGLLHDALEDQHERTSIDELTRRFGPEVSRIVVSCTDGVPGAPRDGSTWLDRKVGYLTHLWDGDRPALLVTCADKISNARAIVNDHAEVGDVLWSRFNARPGQIAWYYDEVTQAVSRARPLEPLTNQLVALSGRITGAAGAVDALAGVADGERSDVEAALAALEVTKRHATT